MPSVSLPLTPTLSRKGGEREQEDYSFAAASTLSLL